MAKHRYRLVIPAEVKVSHRDPTSLAPVEMAHPTHEDFDEIEQAKARALELRNDGVSRLPDLYEIERIPDGVVVCSYEVLHALAQKSEDEG